MNLAYNQVSQKHRLFAVRYSTSIFVPAMIFEFSWRVTERLHCRPRLTEALEGGKRNGVNCSCRAWTFTCPLKRRTALIFWLEAVVHEWLCDIVKTA